MNQTVIIVVAVIVVIALLLLFLLRGRKQRVTFGDQIAPPRPVTPAAPKPEPVIEPVSPVVPAPVIAPEPAPIAEGHGVSAEITAAVEDVVDQFVGIYAHPSGRQPKPASTETAGDTLTQIKGLGPKAASRLAELGVAHFAQIASWNDKEVEAIDAQMGSFKGRILRDRWVDQAKLLAAGDTAGFEATFGKLGG